MGTIGLGTASEYSRIRIPNPPQNRTTFIIAPSCNSAGQLTGQADSGDDLDGRNGHNEFCTPFANERHLLDNLILEIPRQNKQVVGAGLKDFIGRKDGNMSPGE